MDLSSHYWTVVFNSSFKSIPNLLQLHCNVQVFKQSNILISVKNRHYVGILISNCSKSKCLLDLELDLIHLRCKIQWAVSPKKIWLKCPTKVRSTQLSHIFKALIRATPLAHRFCISGSRWQVAGGQGVRWQVAGGKKTITYYPACRVGDLAMRKYVRKSNLFKICIAARPFT